MLASNHKSILKCFNEHLLEFLDDLIVCFPNDITLKTSKTYLEGIKKINPKAILIHWKYYVTEQYKNEIYNGNIDYFLNKNYEEDVTNTGEYSSSILNIIEKLRIPLLQLTNKNKEKAKKYILNLVKLSELY